MKKIILLVICMSFGKAILAQDFTDNALIFSRTTPGGSARIQGLGGAQVSLGGDYSSAYSNPAGLGMYNRSEFTVTPALNFSKAKSTYFGSSTTDNKTTFFIPGVSLVFHNNSGRDQGFVGGSFGITLNRINNFNQNFTYSGVNPNNTIVQSFLEDANGLYFNNEILDPASLEAGEDNFYNLTALAFHNFLIDTLRDGSGNLYYDSPLTVYWDGSDKTGSVRQMETAERSGAQYQWSLSYGANFSDKVFVGATLGLTSLKFKLHQTYRESDFSFDTEPTFTPLSAFSIDETYNISGNGVNFGIGVIYRPVNQLQVGASITTPTVYSITDNYEASITSSWNNFDYYGDGSTVLGNESKHFDVPLVSEYNLRTPLRVEAGATFIGESGFISADVEFMNYGRARYSADYSFDEDNRAIKSDYQSSVNARVGGELRFLTNYRARAGVNYMSNPLSYDGVNRKIFGGSLGFGYRVKTFFIDFAGTFSTTKGQRIPYFVSTTSPVATQRFSTMTYMVTLGFPF